MRQTLAVLNFTIIKATNQSIFTSHTIIFILTNSAVIILQIVHHEHVQSRRQQAAGLHVCVLFLLTWYTEIYKYVTVVLCQTELDVCFDKTFLMDIIND